MSQSVTNIRLLNTAISLNLAEHRKPLIEKDDGKVRPDSIRILSMRKQHGLSRERLAGLTGIAPKTLRNLETKPSYRCNPSTIGILAKHYGVAPSTLILPEDQPGLRLLTSVSDIIEAKRKIITSAKRVLACIGSRSWNEELMRLIEATLAAKPDMVHYRTMSLPPFKREFQAHLLRMLKIRNSSGENKTLHIGFYDCLVRQSESYIYANETMALVMLPCISGIGNLSTAVLFEDAVIAQKYIELAKDLYQRGKAIETEQDIRSLGFAKGEDYQYSLDSLVAKSGIF